MVSFHRSRIVQLWSEWCLYGVLQDEGRYLAVLPREHEEEALNLMRGCGVSAGACVIGRVEELSLIHISPCAIWTPA